MDDTENSFRQYSICLFLFSGEQVLMAVVLLICILLEYKKKASLN